MSDFAIGDHVAYSANFLRSISCYTGDMPHGRGTIVKLTPIGRLTLATIEWDRDLPDTVITANLAKVGSAGFSAT
jgi:hypothetical protein